MSDSQSTENSAVAATPIPIHQWTHNGDHVLIVKCVNRDGTSYGDFNRLHDDRRSGMNNSLKQTGILFKPEMVRAILDRRKTQTRRVMSQPPFPHLGCSWVTV